MDLTRNAKKSIIKILTTKNACLTDLKKFLWLKRKLQSWALSFPGYSIALEYL